MKKVETKTEMRAVEPLQMMKPEVFAEPEPVIMPPVELPSRTADWFSLDSIHAVERDSLPEFFNGRYPSKNEHTYKEYRNFMVLLYR